MDYSTDYIVFRRSGSTALFQWPPTYALCGGCVTWDSP